MWTVNYTIASTNDSTTSSFPGTRSPSVHNQSTVVTTAERPIEGTHHNTRKENIFWFTRKSAQWINYWNQVIKVKIKKQHIFCVFRLGTRKFLRDTSLLAFAREFHPCGNSKRYQQTRNRYQSRVEVYWLLRNSNDFNKKRFFENNCITW
jgi:hypothetical protein